MSDVFKALADPTRREILLMISKKPESVNALAKRFNISRPAVSKHIKILVESNLTRIERDEQDQRQRNCIAHLEALEEVNLYIDQLDKFWNERLDGLASFLKKTKKKKKS